MRRTISIVVVAIVFVIASANLAFADHSPTFYVEWNQSAQFQGYVATFGNQGTGNPHQGYLEGTEKCAVCHSVHRAPVPGMKWDTDPANAAARTPVAGGQYNRAEWVSDSADTQMLLIDNVANSCNFCHVYTSIGNKQLYAGKPEYINSTDALGSDEWDEGFGHHNGCTGCHAVHGVSSNYGDTALYGQYGTFQGPLRPKIIKVRAKGATTPWQDEVITAGSQGVVTATSLYGSFWSSLLVADDTAVDPRNVPLFPSASDAIMGNNPRPDAASNVRDAQVSAFCTFCHQNYGWASENTVNPDGDTSLFQAPWYALAGTVPNVTGTSGSWVSMNAAAGRGAPFKNHPLKFAEATLTADGKSASVGKAAWVGSSTCRACHDAGRVDAVGVIVQSYPHFTPGYFHFVKSASHVGGTMTNAPRLGNGQPVPELLTPAQTAELAQVQAWLDDPVSYEKAVTVADGQCLKCHVDATDTLGVGKTF